MSRNTVTDDFTPDDEFRKCAFCYTERTCRYYSQRGIWICLKGPSKCWRRRVTGKIGGV